MTDEQRVEVVAREAGVHLTPERLANLAREYAGAREMIATMDELTLDLVPVRYVPDWDEPVRKRDR